MEEEHDKFKTLQKKLVSSPLLALSQTRGHFIRDMDTYDKEVGCILM